MPGLTLQLDRDDASYVPGEPITGSVAWDLDQAPEGITVRLLWHTSGKGSRDMGVVGEQTWELVSSGGQEPFSFPGIDGPYSFSGRLITVSWVVEAVTQGTDLHTEVPFSLSPSGEEVRP